MAATQQQTSVADTHVHGPPVAVVMKGEVTALAFREADDRDSAADSIEEVESNAAEAARGWLAVEHDCNRSRLHDSPSRFPPPGY